MQNFRLVDSGENSRPSSHLFLMNKVLVFQIIKWNCLKELKVGIENLIQKRGQDNRQVKRCSASLIPLGKCKSKQKVINSSLLRIGTVKK